MSVCVRVLFHASNMGLCAGKFKCVCLGLLVCTCVWGVSGMQPCRPLLGLVTTAGLSHPLTAPPISHIQC